MAIFYGFAALFFSELFSYIKRSKAGACVQSKLTNLSDIKEPRIDSPWKRQVFKLRPGQSLISSLVMGIAKCFLWERFLKVFGSAQSDVLSGTSMTTSYVCT